MFKFLRRRKTTPAAALPAVESTEPQTWTPGEVPPGLSVTFRDPWADDPDRTTRRESYR